MDSHPLDIIEKFKDYKSVTDIFTDGFCYDFAMMLWRNIPDSKIYLIQNWNENGGHYVLKYKDKYYDINGEVEIKDHHRFHLDRTEYYLQMILNDKITKENKKIKIEWSDDYAE